MNDPTLLTFQRCEVCGWPLYADPQNGCTKGNCSQRPVPKPALPEFMIKPQYQTVTLVLGDGQRVHYTGRAQMDHINPPRVVEVIISGSNPLPDGMTWDVMPQPKEGKDVCR